MLACDRLRIDYRAIGKVYHDAESSGAAPDVLRAIEGLVELPVPRLFAWLNKVWMKTLQEVGKEGVPITWRVDPDLALAREPYKELFQSFLHIVRNAADHGIERPEERIRLGKSAAGAMHIDCQYSDGVYRVTFEDDGAGIDPENLISAAILRGFQLPKSMTTESALMLISEPGFSSHIDITEISGRGIGLSAVRRAARLCGGDLSIESVVGRGTKITVWFKRRRYW
jgi:two-component system chemotaxis sensor kinase CheA